MKYITIIFWVILLLFLTSPSSNPSSTSVMYDEPRKQGEHKIQLFEDIKRDRKEKFDRVQKLVEHDKKLEELDQIINVFTEVDVVKCEVLTTNNHLAPEGRIDPVTGLPLPKEK